MQKGLTGFVKLISRIKLGGPVIWQRSQNTGKSNTKTGLPASTILVLAKSPTGRWL